MQTPKNREKYLSERKMSCVPDLIFDLQKLHQEHRASLKMQLLSERKLHLKIKRSLQFVGIQQPNFRVNHSMNVFTAEQSIDKDDPFVEMRVKRNLIVPSRAFEKIPNLRAGSYEKDLFSYGNKLQADDKRNVDRKFQQFSRIVDDQNGAIKKKRLEKLRKFKKSLKVPTKRTTFFSKMQGDQFNFYGYNKPKLSQSIERQAIFDLTSIGKMKVQKLDLSDVSNMVDGIVRKSRKSKDQYMSI